MKILFIAPLPPPIGGHSLVSKVLLEELVLNHKVEVVNFNKESFIEGLNNYKRIFEVAKILQKIWLKKKDINVIYLTISESLAGNIKDLIIYLICFRNLNKMYIHLHGGSIKKLLWDRNRTLLGINKIFINKLAGVIVSGKSHLEIFEGMIHKNKIHIVPNFALDYLFLTEKEIQNKFSCTQPLKILFISNFIQKKGFNELVDAYFQLNNTLREKIRIDFAGRFESEDQKEIFLNKIDRAKQIRYHGPIDDNQKKLLFAQAHIFCLPTSFYEGQPISILEAYASGCVVITTGQSGIRDIFTHGLNGFEVEERSAKSIKLVLEEIIEKPEELFQIAIVNRKIAGEKYRMSNYKATLKRIIESPVCGLARGN
jgi:glycosyltransferase involved in cell wall biosynthesis